MPISPTDAAKSQMAAESTEKSLNIPGKQLELLNLG